MHYLHSVSNSEFSWGGLRLEKSLSEASPWAERELIWKLWWVWWVVKVPHETFIMAPFRVVDFGWERERERECVCVCVCVYSCTWGCFRSHEPVPEALRDYLGSEQKAPFPSRYLVLCRPYSWRGEMSMKFRIKWRDSPLLGCVWSWGLVLCRSQSLSLTSLSAADAQFRTLIFSWLHCGVTFYKRLKLEISSFMPGELLETCLDQSQRKWTQGPVP